MSSQRDEGEVERRHPSITTGRQTGYVAPPPPMRSAADEARDARQAACLDQLQQVADRIEKASSCKIASQQETEAELHCLVTENGKLLYTVTSIYVAKHLVAGKPASELKTLALKNATYGSGRINADRCDGDTKLEKFNSLVDKSIALPGPGQAQ